MTPSNPNFAPALASDTDSLRARDIRRRNCPFLVSALLSASALVGIPGSSAFAQTPPDSVRIYAAGATAVGVNWWSCQTSQRSNCELYFTIYRNPPGFSSAPIVTVSVDANDYEHSTVNYQLQPRRSYSYLVCTGERANNDKSNCAQSNTVTTPPLETPGQVANGGASSSSNAESGYAPPANVRGESGGSTVALKWTPPNQGAFVEILRAITGGTAPMRVDSLADSVGQWTDYGPLPHLGYTYYVCEGTPSSSFNDCAATGRITTWGANPVLTATRSDTSTVKLSVAVDNIFTLKSLMITRQGSDDPCRQGTTLANGGQGCRTPSVGANGVPVNAPKVVTVYQHTDEFGSNTASAPYVIAIPDDHVTPGVSYYYQASATWYNDVTQQSEVANAPAGSLILARYHGMARVSKVAPVPVGRKPATNSVAHQPTANSVARRPTANFTAALNHAQKSPNDAASLYALGAEYCGRGAHDQCVSLMYMALLQAEKHGQTKLSAQISTRLSKEGVQIAR